MYKEGIYAIALLIYYKKGSYIKRTIFRLPETENRTKEYQTVIFL